MTLAHDSARHLAYVILELERGEHDRDWLLEYFQETQKGRVNQYIRFADFWYASNGQFTDLQEITKEIAKEAGMKLTPQAAFRWLSLGGFNLAEIGRPGVGGLDLGAIKEVTSIFTDNSKVTWEVNKYNTFKLDLDGAEQGTFPVLVDGRIERQLCWRRDAKTLPYGGVHSHVVDVLKQCSNIQDIITGLRQRVSIIGGFHIHDAISTLETMLIDGWVLGSLNKKKPRIRYDPPRGTDDHGIHSNRDKIPGLKE